MELNDDSTMYFQQITDCAKCFDAYVVFMVSLRGNFDYKIGRFFLYCRASRKLTFLPIKMPSDNARGYIGNIQNVFDRQSWAKKQGYIQLWSDESCAS